MHHNIDPELAQALVKLAKAAAKHVGAPEPDYIILHCNRKEENTIMTEDEQFNEEAQFEELYGPQAPFSDHKRGEVIKFREGGQIQRGEILWVAAAGEMNGKQVPVRYIVDTPGFPTIVYTGEIIEE